MPGNVLNMVKFILLVCALMQTSMAYQFFFGPNVPSEQADWFRQLVYLRTKFQQKVDWHGGAFEKVKWTQTSYIQPQMHIYDRYFYDSKTGKYTVDKFLQDLKDRYGGIDAALIWPTYTNIGVDDRNQFDYFRALPGGLSAVANFTQELKHNGVHVFWPYNPWDVGTQRENLSDAETFAKLLKQTNADGINGDTMTQVGEVFWNAGLAVDHPYALEPEVAWNMSDSALNWTTMGWGYWNIDGQGSFSNRSYTKIPLVDRFKFFSDGKYMTNICDRWRKDKTSMVQFAWFNGDGVVTWENVWGSWNGITKYDGEQIRRVAKMLRYFGKEGYLQSFDWEPHTQEVVQSNVYASKWPLPKSNSTLWTMVNRASKDLSDMPQLMIEASEGQFFYDCYHGKLLNPTFPDSFEDSDRVKMKESQRPRASRLVGKLLLNFSIEANGYGCILSTESEASDQLSNFLKSMNALTQKPLASFSKTWNYLPQKMVEMRATKLVETAPPGMVHIPSGEFNFMTSGVEIEGNDSQGVDVQFPWEAYPRRFHEKNMHLNAFYIDKYPVTTTNYSKYLSATGYQPISSYNWLRNWEGKSTPPASIADVPVTYVSLNEARKYCAWAHGGSRLPQTYEWQYAAQGHDGRTYTWGSDMNETNFPRQQNGTNYLGPEPVTAHSPAGDSPFGVSDLIGNVWQYTSEFQDEHTRSVILKGGSNYRPFGSAWYFRQAKALNRHQKYFLMDDSYERAGTIGFRCVVDAASPTQSVTI